MSLLAVDIGSSTCKAIVFAANGAVLAQSSISYIPEFPHPSFAEMDPRKFWDAVCSSCRDVCKNLNESVQALCLSSHGETFLAVDSRGEPVTNAILNQDGRAVWQSAECERLVGRQRLFGITGQLAHAMYPVAKILWLRKHQPEIYASAKTFPALISYILQKMELPAYVDYSLASRFLAFDVCSRCWSDEILEAVDLDKACLPIAIPAGTVAGKLDSQTASQLGVPAGTPVVLGGHDQPCGALGAGVVGCGRVFDSMGTYECLVAASDAPILNEKALEASLNSYCHVVPDKFVTLAYFPSGIMVKWFHDLLYAGVSGEKVADSHAENLETNHYAFLEAHSPDGPTGLCITPHLIGTCNPDFNSRARGMIAGLGPGIGRSHIYKGILEGVACELAIVAEKMAEAMGDFQDIYVTGGGTRSALGLHLRSSLTGRRLHVMTQQEAVCLGGAILAGVAIGQYASIGEAIETLVSERCVISPDKEIAASYRDQANRYRRLRSVAVQQGDFLVAQKEED